MSQESRSSSAHQSDCPACNRDPQQSDLDALGLEPTRLEREPRLGALVRTLLLASAPALAIPGCTGSGPALDTSVGLDTGTVGMVEPLGKILEDEAA